MCQESFFHAAGARTSFGGKAHLPAYQLMNESRHLRMAGPCPSAKQLPWWFQPPTLSIFRVFAAQ